MATTGTATLDFGAVPGGNAAAVVVTGQAAILATSYIEAWMMYEASADHNAEEHALVPVKLTCGTIVPGTGFTIYGRTDWRLTGQFKVRWVWT